MSGSLIRDADDVVKLQNRVIDGTCFKDCTMTLIHPGLDRAVKLRNEGKETEIGDDQIEDMLGVTDDKGRDITQEER